MQDTECIRILLVEDNRIEVRLIKAALAKAQATNPHVPRLEIVSAERLATAGARLAEYNIDVVLLDLSLPDSNGLSTLETVRERWQNVPIVVLTSRDDEELALKAVHLGAQDYLIKDQNDGQAIVRALRYAIERHRLLCNLSLIDDLTGLYNRRGFTTLAAQQIKSMTRTRKPALLVFADLDDLKNINDLFGHSQGSHALILVAETLKRTFRGSDIIARFGGDEFVVFATDTDHVGEEVIITRLMNNFEKLNREHGLPYCVTISTGVAPIESPLRTSLEEIIAEADQAMYKQKRLKKAAYEGVADERALQVQS